MTDVSGRPVGDGVYYERVMVTVKEAAQTALTFAHELLGDTRVNSLLLEEIEFSDTKPEWLVTISVPVPGVSKSLAMLSGVSDREPRDYKIIRIDAETGTPQSIKIRKV